MHWPHRPTYQNSKVLSEILQFEPKKNIKFGFLSVGNKNVENRGYSLQLDSC